MPDVHATILAPDGDRRAVIHRRPDGFFQTAYELWDDTVVAAVGGIGDPFWRAHGEIEVHETLDVATARARQVLGLDAS